MYDNHTDPYILHGKMDLSCFESRTIHLQFQDYLGVILKFDASNIEPGETEDSSDFTFVAKSYTLYVCY